MTEEMDSSIPQKLKELRRARGLSVTKLAERMGENHQKIGRIERGKSKLSIDYLLKVSKALDAPIDTIVTNEIPSTEPEKADVKPDSITLSDVIIFIEKNFQLIFPNGDPMKKADLLATIFQLTSEFPKQCEGQFLSSLLKILGKVIK